MTFYNRMAAFFAAIALAMSALFLISTPASAGVPPTPAGQDQAARTVKPSSCGSSLLCMYTGDGWSGNREDRLKRANGTCDNVAYNDQYSSIWNGSGVSVRFYNDAGCTGQAFTLVNGDGSAHMTLTHPTQVDEISSIKWLS